MNEDGLRDDERLASGGTLKAWHLAVIALVAIAGVFAVYHWFLAGREAAPPEPGVVTEVPEGSRTVTLFFADEDEPALFGQTRQVAISADFDEQVSQVIKALIAGPTGKGVSTIPDGTKLLDVFYDPESFTVYLDFSGELVSNHPGGSSAEYYTVSAIVRTVSENFPEVQAVQILVEGSQVGTIAGHISAQAPFPVGDWR